MRSLFIFFIFSFYGYVDAQENQSHIESIKTIVHSDVLVSGDSLYFSNHIFNTVSKKPSFKNKILYTFLTDSEGDILNKKKIKINKGVGHGAFLIPTGIKTGRYFLISSTVDSRTGKQLQPCIKQIEIVDKISFLYNYRYIVSRDSLNDILNIEFEIVDRTGNPLDNAIAKLSYRNENSRYKHLREKTNPKGIVKFSIKNPANYILNNLRLSIKYNDYEETKAIFISKGNKLDNKKFHDDFENSGLIWKVQENVFLETNIQKHYPIGKKVHVRIKIVDSLSNPVRGINTIRVIHDIKSKEKNQIYQTLRNQNIELSKVPLTENIEIKAFNKVNKKIVSVATDTVLMLKTDNDFAFINIESANFNKITPVALSKLGISDTIVGKKETEKSLITLQDDITVIEEFIKKIDFTELYFKEESNSQDYQKQLPASFSFESLNLLDNVVISKKKKSENTSPFSNTDWVCFNDILNCSNHRTGSKPIDGVYYIMRSENGQFVKRQYVSPNNRETEQPLVIIGFDKFDESEGVEFKDDLSFQDIRTNLYWNPIIISSADGYIDFTFETSMIKGKYYIDLDGYSLNGAIYSQRFSFDVK